MLSRPALLLEIAKRPEQRIEGRVLSYSRWLTFKGELNIALGEVMSDRTAGTTVICLGDMCWLIRQFDIKP
jgi:hypothetical protein